MDEGFKFNFTRKEEALRQLIAEMEERENLSSYQNVMADLNLEVIRR